MENWKEKFLQLYITSNLNAAYDLKKSIYHPNYTECSKQGLKDWAIYYDFINFQIGRTKKNGALYFILTRNLAIGV